MIELVDGDLYQWDTGRIVRTTAEMHEIHFTTDGIDFAYVVKTYVEGDIAYGKIPNILLQQERPIMCYDVRENDEGEESVSVRKLKITKRNRPEDYVYTEDELVTFKNLDERIRVLENRSSKPDYAQNDETSVDYIKNRPFYDSRDTESEMVNITWDGDTTGRTVASGNYGTFGCKVSDCIFTEEQLRKMVYTTTSGSKNLENAYLSETDEYIAYGDSGFIVIKVAGSDGFGGGMPGCVYPETGLYFGTDGRSLFSSEPIEITTGELKTLDGKFVPDDLFASKTHIHDYNELENKPCYVDEEYIMETIIPETTLQCDDPMYSHNQTIGDVENGFEFIVGDNYEVIIIPNGEDERIYSSIIDNAYGSCTVESSTKLNLGVSINILGSIEIKDGSDGQKVFELRGTTGFYDGDMSNFTLTLKHQTENVHKLDKKFIPDDYLTESKLDEAIDAALEQAKESGEFKGDKGDTGATGAKGDKGDTGATGPKGDTGAVGPKGEKGDTGTTGATGQNGKSAYQIWLDEGNTGDEVAFLTSLKGDQGLKGEKGDKGDTGEKGVNGTTPVKGVDYFTETDKEELVASVLAALPDGNEVAY